MKKLAVFALPGLLVITAAMGFLSSLTRNNASHSISDASRETSSRSAAAQTVTPATPNPPAPAPAAAQATTQVPASSSVPPLLSESVTANFPGYRIPGAADVKEAWSASDAGASPFLAQGDFNGDGRSDAALIILGESDWRLVIFEQDDQQHYMPAAIFRAKTTEEVQGQSADAVIASPQQIVLTVIKQGETWTPEAGDVRSEVRLKSDSIALSHRAMPDTDSKLLIFFDDGKYQMQFADSLLQIR